MDKPFQINSVSVPLIGSFYLDDSYDADGYDDFIERIIGTGADSARFIVTIHLENSLSNDYSEEIASVFNPSDERIASLARDLKEKGLDIEIQNFVIVHEKTVQNNIFVDRAAPSDPKLWMKNHSEEILRWAKFSEQIGAKRFNLFSDIDQHMTFLPELTADWVRLADDVRKVFSGHLTACAWTDAREYDWQINAIDKTPDVIWNKLDSIGVGFFPEPLTNLKNPTVSQLINGWYENGVGMRPLDFLKNLSERFDKPIYIADRTFRSFDGTNINEGQVYNKDIPLTPDFQEQADLYESFLRVFSLEQGDWLLGVSFNSVARFANQPIDSVDRYLRSAVGEDFDQKPAGKIVSDWFTGQRQSQGRLFAGDTDTDKNDRIVGGYHHDSLEGGLGDDYLDGGAGIDTAIYSGVITDYSIQAGANATVRDSQQQRDGADTLVRVERAQFTDKNLALDTDGVAGKAYRIYKAAFDRAPDFPGLGYWINDMDGGTSLTTVAAGFIASEEFQNRYGAAVSEVDFITLLYANVLDRTPDQQGLDYWINDMKNGMSRAAVLASFSESDENQRNVAGLIANGIEYTPFIS